MLATSFWPVDLMCDATCDTLHRSFLQESVLSTGEVQVEEALLEGHLGVTKELLTFQTSDKKFLIGSEKGGNNLIKVRFLKTSDLWWIHCWWNIRNKS